MDRRLTWLAALLAAFALSACGLSDDDDTDSSDTSDDATEETADEVTDDDADGSTETGSPADYDSFSLSVAAAVVDSAYNMDGIELELVAQVGDRFNKAVDDDTVVYFWAENGILQQNYCLTVSGTCTVTWVSGGTRPLDGLGTILAYAVGEDSYKESGVANGIYNVSGDIVGDGAVALGLDEAILSAPEAYKDYNFDGYTDSDFTDLGTGLTLPGDAFYDYNEDNVYEASSTVFRGEDCSASATTAGHCAETSIYVWDHTQIVWNVSNVAPTVTIVDAGSDGNWDLDEVLYVSVSDALGNYPPAGTAISVEPLDTDSGWDPNYDNGSEVQAVGLATNDPYVFEVTLKAADETGVADIYIYWGDYTYHYYYNYN